MSSEKRTRKISEEIFEPIDRRRLTIVGIHATGFLQISLELDSLLQYLSVLG